MIYDPLPHARRRVVVPVQPGSAESDHGLRLCQACVEREPICAACGSDALTPVQTGEDESVYQCADCGAVEDYTYRKWEDGE